MAYQSEIEKLEQRYRENPDQWFAALADSYRKAGSLDLALDVVKAGLDKRPNYVSGHIVLGRCLLQKPDDVAANQAFEKVLALDAENVIALKALSEISERAGRAADAQRWLTRLLEVDPMNEEAEQALKKLKEAAPAPPSAPAGAAGAAEATGGAGEAEGAEAAAVAPVAGFEATAAETPAVAEAAAPPAAPPEEEPAFTIEKSVEATEEVAHEKVSLDALELEGADTPLPVGGGEAPAPAAAVASGLEPMEFEAPAPEETPHEAGVESMSFEAPSADDLPPAAPDLEPMEFEPPPAQAVPAADLAAQPFDSNLGWGTGQRRSGQVSEADLASAERAHEPALEPVLAEPPSPSQDLPLIFPDEVATPAPAPAAREVETGGTEPEPVLTETMAELYAKQGLVTEARDIYRKLVAQRPGDATLAARLEALESAPGGRRPSGARVAAAQTGGPSARDFLSQVFGGEAGAPAPSLPAARPSAAQGAPTRRASDEVSLASVFGEEAPAPRPAGGPGAGSKQSGQGFSFDEFFGAARSSAGRPSSAQPPVSGGGEDEDDFKRWLKGLKS